MPNSCQELLQAMVGFDTVNGAISGKPAAELALARFLEAQARSWGLGTQRLPVRDESFNLLITHRGAGDAAWLLFDSHLDTVSVTGMTIDPFAGQIKEGRLYGRGACDTKGTGAAILWALKQVAAGPATGNNIALLFSLDEEIGKTGARTFIKDQLPELDWKPAGVIIGEPTELQAVVAHNGVVRWRIETTGRAAHSSDPAQGQSAIRMMLRVVAALEERYIAKLTAAHPLTGPARCSINIIRGGVQINIIPEQCQIHIDRRVVPGEKPDHVLPTVETLLDELRQGDNELQVSQHPPDHLSWPLDPTGGEAFAGFVQRVLSRMELPSDLIGVGFGTNGSDFSRAGFPTVVLGPGNVAQAHTHDEWIDLAQLQRGIEVYRQLMVTPL